MPHAIPPQPGLAWKSSLFGFEPCWTLEPRIDIIKDIACKVLDESHRCTVEFYAQGAFNKLYLIRCNKGEFMMRVSLPVDPRYKTLSEVATLDFVRQNTDIPVPKVFAFNAQNDNELGFEWILMERMPGKPLSERWRTMSFMAKEKLVKRLASFAAQLFRKKLHHMGNLYHREKHGETVDASTHTTSAESFVVDRIVSMQFFWADHLNQDVPRGPFHSSEEWLSARLLFHQNDCERTLRTSEDEDDLETAKKIAQIVQKLVSLVPLAFRSIPEGYPEASALLHDDISNSNTLVDEHGNLTAIIDWECVSALPLWKGCQLPVLLEGRERSERPVKDNYVHDEKGDVDDLFWDHLLEYEQTQLRKVFLDEMKCIEPGWIERHNAPSNRRRTDIEVAIQYCNNELCIKRIGEWLAELRRNSNISRLKKLLME